jgi:hypothetical protein
MKRRILTKKRKPKRLNGNEYLKKRFEKRMNRNVLKRKHKPNSKREF